MVTHRLITLGVLAAFCILAGSALAQSAFPAPLPGQQVSTSVEACINGFRPLRVDAEDKGRIIKAASERHASPEEACKLIHNYSVAEARMIEYLEANASQCGVQASLVEQVKAGRRNTEVIEARVCTAVEQEQRRRPGLPVGDFPDPNGRF
jgi:hypothetical protein